VAHQRGHATALLAAKVASMAGVGKLIIGHFSARYKDERVLLDEARTLFEATELAVEGCTFEIPKQK
jgi:ribonuclease Z